MSQYLPRTGFTVAAPFGSGGPYRPSIDAGAFRVLAFGIAARGWIEAVRRPRSSTGMMANALEKLGPRERDILVSRRLLDQAVPLEILASRHRIDADQVRLIELSALAAVQRTMKGHVARNRAATRRQAALPIRACA